MYVTCIEVWNRSSLIFALFRVYGGWKNTPRYGYYFINHYKDVVSNICLFSPLFGEDSDFDYIFQSGWNHHLETLGFLQRVWPKCGKQKTTGKDDARCSLWHGVSHWVFVSKFSEGSPTQISRIDWTLIISPPTASLNLYRWHHPRVLTCFFVLLVYQTPWSCCNGLPLLLFVVAKGVFRRSARRPCGVAPNSLGWNLGFVLLVALGLTSLGNAQLGETDLVGEFRVRKIQGFPVLLFRGLVGDDWTQLYGDSFINHEIYKAPHEITRIQWKVRFFFFVALLEFSLLQPWMCLLSTMSNHH